MHKNVYRGQNKYALYCYRGSIAHLEADCNHFHALCLVHHQDFANSIRDIVALLGAIRSVQTPRDKMCIEWELCAKPVEVLKTQAPALCVFLSTPRSENTDICLLLYT